MTSTLDVDYLVIGAGAAGMAFTDALVGHSDDKRVAVVDRRHAAGGHWLDDYPFVRLHQASSFYGVASTLLGEGRVQADGPEQGLHERASAPQVCDYFDRVRAALEATGRVAFHFASEHTGDEIVSRVSGRRLGVPEGCRVVDARYLAPDTPVHTPPPFAVGDGARVQPVNALADLETSPSEFVVVGSGKTATDACVWLLGQGVDPDRICWVRARDPWMFDRAGLQPDPAVFISMSADIFEAAAEADSPDDLFLRMEDAGVMLRIDPTTTPTMAKTPTLGRWELDLLRSIERVVRLGHLRAVEPGRLVLDGGEHLVASDALVVHCAASGLHYPPLVPIWQPDAIRPQPVRTGFPCFGAAVSGYVEATRQDDEDKNRVCMPSPYSNTPLDWLRMQLLGGRSSRALNAERDVKAWVDNVALNPARVSPDRAGDPAVGAAVRRFRDSVDAGFAAMSALYETGRAGG